MYTDSLFPVRASMPVFTALFCWVLLRTRLSLRSYLTLVPIVVGVGVTTVTESDFSLVGMLCGLAATSGSRLSKAPKLKIQLLRIQKITKF